MKHHQLLAALALLAASGFCLAAEMTPAELSAGFQNPPDSARPLIFWQWMNGCVSKEGITADLKSFKRVGLGGVQNFQVGGSESSLDDPSVQIGNPQWRGLMRFAENECARLGLSFGTHNCPGWSSSGSPRVAVEDSMRKLVWTEQDFTGPGKFSGKLAQPAVDPKWNYYRDIAVLAVSKSEPTAAVKVIDLTGKMDAGSQLVWDAPAGDWTILRFGHTTTGKINGTAPVSGQGLECDKMSRAAVDKFWAGYPAQLIADAGTNAGKTFVRLEIDSYEAGCQDWTPAMREEFKKRRGYDPLPWLPVLAGKIIGDQNLSRRFQQDWKQTISDLFVENYYGYMDELARRTPGLQLLIEPYSTGGGCEPFIGPDCSGGRSLLACEFWAKPATWGWDSVKPVTSSAHTWGKPLVFGESFTGQPQYAWRADPYSLKSTGDRAFCLGMNKIIMHAAAQQPWTNVEPGMTMGWWGTQFGPGQTWWKHGGPEWISYLSRCQFLLQQGLFAADVCYLVNDRVTVSPPAGYEGDACGERELLTRMSVKNGRLVMPDGMSYRVLVLPDRDTMLPQVARKIRQLVNDGATVIGPKPWSSPSLENYPACDRDVAEIGNEVWGDCDGKTIQERAFGHGKVIWGKSIEAVLNAEKIAPDVQFSDGSGIMWIHRIIGNSDVYFISNQKEQSVDITASFRVAGRAPEFWRPDTGQIENAARWQNTSNRTAVALELDPSGSTFVVFRQPTNFAGPGLQKKPATIVATLDIDGPWELQFPPSWGAPEHVALGQLASWSENTNAGVKYFSGTATYLKEIELPADFLAPSRSVVLDLGTVKNIAAVSINGVNCGTLWKPPFRPDVSCALKPGKNRLEIRVTNLWPNRLIGDEQQPDDCEWGDVKRFPYVEGDPVIGRPLLRVPQWLKDGSPRPSSGRYTFTTFKFFTKDSPLLESGLMGPVKLEIR